MRAPIRKSLHRQAMVLGGDRELVLFSGLAAFLTGMGGFSLSSALCGVLFWMAALFWLRKWGQEDPLMRHVWLRHIRQQDFYAARSPFFQSAASGGPWKRG